MLYVFTQEIDNICIGVTSFGSLCASEMLAFVVVHILCDVAKG